MLAVQITSHLRNKTRVVYASVIDHSKFDILSTTQLEKIIYILLSYTLLNRPIKYIVTLYK